MGGIFALKVCVYAICKNESQFVDRFMDSMSEADYVCVLDTGSSDDTVKKLRARGAIVGETVVSPWRFDTARNESLGLIPADADICCAIDLDEQFHPGWRAALAITERPRTYICEADAWGSLPYDLLSLAYAHLGDAENAADACRNAVERSPQEERLRKNLALFEQMRER